MPNYLIILAFPILFTLAIFLAVYQSLASDYFDTNMVENYYYSFNTDGVLYETASLEESRSVYWWLNSGGKLLIENGVGKTIQNELPIYSKWFLEYRIYNSKDTDKGSHPQNIFRLVTKDKWENFTAQTDFKINKINLSDSDNRNESNGFLFFLRYQDGDNLYYAGIRVDGAAVIKKKLNGEYYTLAYEKIFKGEYDRQKNPNLLPIGEWLGMKADIKDTNKGVKIIFYVKTEKNDWLKAAEAVDTKETILGDGYSGIRTDFMDVEFDNFTVLSEN